MGTLRLLRAVAGFAAYLVAFASLGAAPSANPTANPATNPLAPANAAQARRDEARRFLARRGLLGHSGARQLAEARAQRAAMPRTVPGVIPKAILRSVPGATPASTTLLNQSWQPIGPAQVSTAAYGAVTGRVTSIAADPADSTGNTIYVGTTGGGVWKSTNAAGASASFAPLTDDLPAFTTGAVASISVGAVTVQPGGTGVVIAGTGDPNDALDSYYGAGILRSADGGLTWKLIVQSNDEPANDVSDYSFFGLAFAGFAWSTQTPNLVVAAVTQAYEGAIVSAPEAQGSPVVPYAVKGLYYSTDAGQTWMLATITDGPHQNIQSSSQVVVNGGNAATAVVWNPVRKRFYAAVQFHGYYDSPDGMVWTRLANQPGTGFTPANCPSNPGESASPYCPIFRGALAVQPTTGDLFAITVDDNLLDQGLWQDVCAAQSGSCASSTVAFGQQLPATALEDGSGAITLGDYNLWLAAVPVPGDTLLFAGTSDIFRCSLAAGCAFRNTTNTGTCGAAQVAPFQHAVDASFGASLSLLYFGNDSGLWRSTDNVGQTQAPCGADDANHFQNLNGGLGSLAEVQALAEDPANSGILLAGLGANGTAASTSAEQSLWPQVLDGYGSYVAIDPATPNNWYAQSSSGVGIDLCPNGTACAPAGFAPAVGVSQVGDDAYASPQPSPFLLDPAGSANLILGTCHVWLGPADGLGWSVANLLGPLYPGEGSECDGTGLVQSLAATGPVASAGNAETIYAGMVGLFVDGPQAYAGHLFTASVSPAAPMPSAWTDLWLSPVVNAMAGFNPQEYSISSVTADPHDPTGQTVYATIEGFDTSAYSTPRVYMSTTGGASWINISTNLPTDPANSIAIDPNDANTVYAGLDSGVYVTTAVSTCPMVNCWSVYGTGLPNAPVIQLATFNAGGTSLLRAATYGRGIWQIPLVTAAAPETTATVAPMSLTFDAQQVQTQSASQTVTVTNIGTIPMIVSQASANGDFSATNGCGASVVIGGSCAVQVTFTPTATGARSGTLTISLNIAGGQITVPLAGTGVPGGAIVLLPTALSFGSSAIGVATTPPQNVTISNTGGVAVALQTPTATGDFSIVANTCGTSLAPNFGCTVALDFTPTASGQRSGVFSIVDSVGTQTATLSGIGLSPATDTLSPTSLAFAPQVVGTASAAQAVTLTNSGDSPLLLISTTVSGDFQAVNGCGSTLAGHASCSVTVTYVPTQVGAETGALVVNDIYGRPQTVALSGSGVAPAGISALPTAINFGPWGVSATSAAQTVTVTNSGGVPLSAFTLAITGDFADTTNCPLSPSASTLAAGSSCQVQVTFSPTESGARSGSLTIASAAPTPSFQVALSGNGFAFAMQAEGSSTATVAAGQTATYMLQLAPASGSTGPITFSCASAPPNATCTVNPMGFQLTSGVTASATVTVTTTSGDVPAAALPPAFHGGSLLVAVAAFPVGALCFARSRRRRFLPWMVLLCVACVPLGCGVTATGGASGGTTTGSGTTPAATYNPVVTATGPGTSQSVTLTLNVD
jgi:hypothetical protein